MHGVGSTVGYERKLMNETQVVLPTRQAGTQAGMTQRDSLAAEAVTIVAGLPRSGTSMMMQLLAAGGIPALTDNVRAADADNPRGYYEFEAVKEVAHNRTWLDDAKGKVVKMVYRLLYDLPDDHR